MTVLEALRKQIRDANEAYWKKGKEIISDFEYDKLIRNLRKLSPKDPLLDEIGTEKVENKVRHRQHLYSLDKVYHMKDLLEWAKSVARNDNEVFCVSPKYDGMSIEIQGDRMITRGDGEYGNDVTRIAGCCNAIYRIEYNPEVQRFETDSYAMWPLLEHAQEDERSVGELLIPMHQFTRLKKMYPELFKDYKTPRSMAAGFQNSASDSPILTFKTPMGGSIQVGSFVMHRAYEIRQTLAELLAGKRDFVEELRDFNGYPTDGIVFRLADDEYAASLGFTSHHPKGAMALKFSDIQNETIVRSIDWQVGERHVTPVANFDVVEVNGTHIQRATLHCAEFVRTNSVKVGSRITVEKRGDVIPKVVRVINDPDNKNHVEVPSECPICGSKLRQEGKFLSCVNDACTARITCKIVRGLNILGLKGVGPSLAHKVVTELMIPDIMTWCLEVTDRELLKAKGFSEAKIKILCDDLNAIMKKGVKPSTLLQAVCIEEVGEMFAKAVNKYAGGVISLMQVVPVDGMYDCLINSPGVNIDALTNFMVWSELHHEKFVEFLNCFHHLTEETENDGIASAEGCVCFTGSGPKPRSELEAIAKKYGFATTDNANLCSVLVCADPNSGSSKLKKAKAKGKLIMSYDDFFKDKS